MLFVPLDFYAQAKTAKVHFIKLKMMIFSYPQKWALLKLLNKLDTFLREHPCKLKGEGWLWVFGEFLTKK